MEQRPAVLRRMEKRHTPSSSDMEQLNLEFAEAVGWNGGTSWEADVKNYPAEHKYAIEAINSTSDVLQELYHVSKHIHYIYESLTDALDIVLRGHGELNLYTHLTLRSPDWDEDVRADVWVWCLGHLRDDERYADIDFPWGHPRRIREQTIELERYIDSALVSQRGYIRELKEWAHDIYMAIDNFVETVDDIIVWESHERWFGLGATEYEPVDVVATEQNRRRLYGAHQRFEDTVYSIELDTTLNALWETIDQGVQYQSNRNPTF